MHKYYLVQKTKINLGLNILVHLDSSVTISFGKKQSIILLIELNVTKKNNILKINVTYNYYVICI